MTRSNQEDSLSRRTFLKGVATLAGATILEACTPGAPGGPTPTPGRITIGFSLPTKAQYRWQFDEQYFLEAVDRLGAEVIVQDANSEETLQASQVENMLAQGIDALVISPLNSEAAGALADMAAEEGVPTVAYNELVLNTENVDYWVARSNIQVGNITAETAMEEKPEGNYVIASGAAGDSVAEEKTQGYLEALQPSIDAGEINVVSQEFHRGWDPALGLQQVENALTATNNNIHAILCNYDGFALSALEALQEQGLEGEVWVGGEDVFPEAARAIAEDRMAMSAFTDLREEADRAAEAAIALVRGETPQGNASKTIEGQEVPGQIIDSFPVTKENLCEFIRDFPGWADYDEVYQNIPEDERPEC